MGLSFLQLVSLVSCVTLTFAIWKQGSRSIYRSKDWCYGEDDSCGEPTWPELCQKGRLQSPVNLPPDNKVPSGHMSFNFPKFAYKLNGYYLENNGQGIDINPVEDRKETEFISPQVRNATYIFDSLNIHWGSDKSKGSEHRVGGKSTSGEVHLRFHRQKYDDLQEAMDDQDAENSVGVVAILLMESDVAPALEGLTQHLSKIQEGGSMEHVKEELDLRPLFKKDAKAYFYEGSSGVPSCAENTIYYVLNEPVEVGKELMEALRSLKTHEGKPMVDNGRKAVELADHYVKVVEVKYTNRDHVDEIDAPDHGKEEGGSPSGGGDHGDGSHHEPSVGKHQGSGSGSVRSQKMGGGGFGNGKMLSFEKSDMSESNDDVMIRKSSSQKQSSSTKFSYGGK